MILKLSIWRDVEEYLARRNDVVIPVGSTEQHGPSGPLGTDLIAAEEAAAGLGEERLCAVAPTIPFGTSQLHSAFPGTISLRPMTMIAVVRDVIASLHRQGFRRFLLVNAHPESAGVLEAAVQQSQGDLDGVRCLLFNWWEAPEVKATMLELFGAREGQHATPGELSLVRKFYPRGVLDLPPMERFEPVAAPARWAPADMRTRYPDGNIGSDPSLASGASGDRLFVVLQRALVAAHRRLVEEP